MRSVWIDRVALPLHRFGLLRLHHPGRGVSTTEAANRRYAGKPPVGTKRGKRRVTTIEIDIETRHQLGQVRDAMTSEGDRPTIKSVVERLAREWLEGLAA